MPKCCILNCTRVNPNKSPLTFHNFPKLKSMIQKWVDVIGPENIDFEDKKSMLYVCSAHFEDKCFYKTGTVMKLFENSIPSPSLLPCRNMQSEPSTDLRVCRTCLAVDCKLVSMDNNLEDDFEQLTGVELQDGDLPTTLCVECAHRLRSCTKFRQKCLRADTLMMDIIKEKHKLTMWSIKSIDRQRHGLTSSLSLAHYPIDHSDLYISENTQLKAKSKDISLPTHHENAEAKEKALEENDKVDSELEEMSIEAEYLSAGEDNESIVSGDAETRPEFSDEDETLESKKHDDDFDDGNVEFTDDDETQESKYTIKHEDDFDAEYLEDDEMQESKDTLKNEDDFEGDSDEFADEDEKKESKDPLKEDDDFEGDNDEFIEDDEMQESKNTLKNEDDFEGDDIDNNKIPESKDTLKNEDDYDTEFTEDEETEEYKNTTKRKATNNGVPKKRYLDNLKELFTIVQITKRKEQIEDLKKHMHSVNYKAANFKCDMCYRGFLDQSAYNAHAARHTTAAGEHGCPVCRLHFKKRGALAKHKSFHHTYRLKCKECDYETTNKRAAMGHKDQHKGTRYQCPHCPEWFEKPTSYIGHIRLKHPSDFHCQLCGYSFVSEKGIKLHKQLKHKSEDTKIPKNGPWCEACNLQFANEDALKCHENCKHKQRRERAPRVRRTREQIEMANIIAGQQKGNSEMECEQCGKILPNARAYNGHFRRMHPDKNRTNYPTMKYRHMCEVCGRIFPCNEYLKDHVRLHTDATPLECETCGKTFKLKHLLGIHRRLHRTQKATSERVKCLICRKNFSKQGNLQRHMVIHSGVKAFKCETCGKAFKHGSEKRAHITYVHLKKPWPKRNRGKRRDSKQVQCDKDKLARKQVDDINKRAWVCD